MIHKAAAAFAVPVYETISTPLIFGASVIMIGGLTSMAPVTSLIGMGFTVYTSYEKWLLMNNQ